jgi:hypothetical protein
MRSILIDVNPRQVTVDLPLDDNNTKEIERQAVAWRGIHTPIEVWIKDAKKRAAFFEVGANPNDLLADGVTLQIMDGLHRTTVAVHLGMPTIPALLYDCTEEEFWDKRISQAKKHHVVKEDRLHKWMIYAWENSEFADQKRDQRFVDTIYLIHQSLIGTAKTKLDREGKKLLEWFGLKAEMWGRRQVEVAKIVLEKEKVLSPKFPEAAIIAEEAGLTVDQTAKLTKAFPRGNQPSFGHGLTKPEMKRYAQEVIAKNEEVTPSEWKKQQEAKRHRDHLRNKAFIETPAGIEAKRKRRIENGIETINGLRSLEHKLNDLLLVDLNELLLARPDLLSRINAFLDKARQLSEKARSGIAVAMPTSEVPKLKERILDLEAQLKARSAPVVVGQESMVIHSEN